MEFNSLIGIIIIIIPVTDIIGILAFWLANATNYVSLRSGQSLLPHSPQNRHESLRTPYIFHTLVLTYLAI